MALKMKELIQKTGESKSTILFYVKEGLLPQPQKPKPNVHLYHDNSVEIVRFIKYLQNKLFYSIADIKNIFKRNNFDFDNSFEMLINSVELISEGRGEQTYDEESFLELAEISPQKLQQYKQNSYIFTHDGVYTQKELEIVSILKSAEKLGFDMSLLDEYVITAKNLAKKENESGSKLLKDDSTTHNQRYKFLFDLILILKPYIFNKHTVAEYSKRIAS